MPKPSSKQKDTQQLARSALDGIVPESEPHEALGTKVAIEPSPEPAAEVDANGWPIGFFDRLAGSWQGDFDALFEGDFEAVDWQT
jgi:hypothetical protein